MKEYHKIETVFNRDMGGTKKLINGDYRSETVEFLKDCQWVFTEKIDGTNIRIHWDGHKVTFAGRTDKAQIPSHLVNRLNELFVGNENEELFEQMFGEKEVTLYGEGYGVKIQNGGNYLGNNVDFILFDILIDGLWLRRKDLEGIAKAFNISVVPIIIEDTIQNAINYVKTKPKSTIGSANMEGLVGKPKVELTDRKGDRIIVKIKVRDF